jgi:hypothetical protein
MIVRSVGKEIRLIAQHDHARAAGTMARNWVGEGPIPQPSMLVKDAVFFAVDNHDVGWCRFDESPSLDNQTQLPRSFFGATAEEAIEIWTGSISFCASNHPLSGYLVSAHFGALAASGISGAPPDDLDRLKEFVQFEERRRQSLVTQLSPPEEAACDTAILLLQTCDTLSLFACRAPEVIPPESQVRYLSRSGLKVRFQSEDVLEIMPWPFHTERLEVRFPGFSIPGERFGNAGEFEEALEMAEPGIFVTELVPLN